MTFNGLPRVTINFFKKTDGNAWQGVGRLTTIYLFIGRHSVTLLVV